MHLQLVFAPLSGAEIEGYEIHMGESVLKKNAGTATRITDSVSGEKKEEGAFAGNVCGTYIHGVFDKEESAEAIIRVIGEKKGIDVENMTGVDFAAFKEQQYDILVWMQHAELWGLALSILVRHRSRAARLAA